VARLRQRSNIIIGVRVTAKEREKLEQKAQDKGMFLSEYIRKKLGLTA